MSLFNKLPGDIWKFDSVATKPRKNGIQEAHRNANIWIIARITEVGGAYTPCWTAGSLCMIALHEGSARPVHKGDRRAGSALVELTHTQDAGWFCCCTGILMTGPEEGAGFPRLGGPDGCEGPCGCGNQTQVLLTEHWLFWLLNYDSSAVRTIDIQISTSPQIPLFERKSLQNFIKLVVCWPYNTLHGAFFKWY